jgi:hypothetical protein
MNLKFDPVDVVGAGCWDTISRLFLFATSVMVGCGIGSWALHAHHMFNDPWDPIFYFASSAKSVGETLHLEKMKHL